MPTPFVADAADEAVRSNSILNERKAADIIEETALRREPKVERPSDAAEEPQVRGILKREQVPCEARGANASNYKFEHSAFFRFWALRRRVAPQERSSERDWGRVIISGHR